jgi:hypothetical protein
MKFIVNTTPSFPAPGDETIEYDDVDVGNGEKMPLLGKLPPDQMPNEVRNAFVGIEFVAAATMPQGKILIENKKNGKRRRRTVGVDGTPGYLITKNQALELIEPKSPEAAAWIKENWLQEWFCFGHEEIMITDSAMFH